MLLVAAASVPAADFSFTSKPTVTKAGAGAKIRFAISAATDVEVAILDARGKIVRHLAAGMLGDRAPSPLKPGVLKQELTWDGKDDLGRAVKGPVRVRVRAGSEAKLERHLGWDAKTLAGSIISIKVSPAGELYVLYVANRGRPSMTVLDRRGRYLRTIMPYPSDTPEARMVGHFTVDGEAVPMVYSGHSGSTLPLTTGLMAQTMAWHPKGYLLLAGAVGTMAEHGPPRHLLALHPQGGSADVGFVGPEIRRAIGFLGGAGERGHRFFDHLALSADGERIYYVPANITAKRRKHVVYRLKWRDKKLGEPFLGELGRPGDDDAHLRDPQGIAVAADGSLILCDWGNDRVLRFSADGKLLGKFAVEKPQQIAVHPKTGIVYILSRVRDKRRSTRWAAEGTLRRFTSFAGRKPRETARLPGKFQLMALDATTPTPRLWTVAGAGWARQALAPVVDTGTTLALGKPVNRYEGLRFPMFVAADPDRGRILVRELYLGLKGIRRLDLKTGRHEAFGIRAADFALDDAGNIYTMDGYRTNSLSRYTPDAKPLPFKSTGSHKLKVGIYRGYGPNIGLQGHCVDKASNIYLIRSSNYGHPGGYGGRVDKFAADGKPANLNLIDGLGYGDCGLGVDAAGNVYVGANIKQTPYPAELTGQLPEKPWTWWKRGKREPPWHYMFINPYLFYWGSVVKFSPAGGALYGHPYTRETDKPIPDVFDLAKAPAGAASYRSGYLGREIKVIGAKWSYHGAGIIPSTSDGVNPDPGCVCLTSRLAVDGFGRVYSPNVFLFAVDRLDPAGNRIDRIGSYGNADDVGPNIHFAWPAFLSVAGGKLYACDSVNGRIAVITFTHAAEAIVVVK